MARRPWLFSGALVVALLSTAASGQERPADAQGGANPPAQQPTPPQPADPQQPVFRTGINFVRVDVIVTDAKGNPVLDLKQSDFEIVEDNKPQNVESFKLIQVGGIPAPGAEPARQIRNENDVQSEAARDDVRIVVIFLDDYHVRLGASLGVKEPLIKFIQMQLAPTDMLGIVYPMTSVHDINLTRNHASVISAIQRFEGRKFDYRPRNEFEERYAYYPADTVERVRNQVSFTGLRALVTHLGGVREGRKTVIVVSEGYTDLLPPQLRSSNAQVPTQMDPYGAGRVGADAGVNDPREETARFLASMDLQEEMRDVYNAANRNNTSLYTLDPRGLTAFEFDVNEGVGMRTDANYLRTTQDTLRTLAENTDGRAIVNRNDLDGGLRQIMRDLSAYYLVGYNSTQAPTDGKFHEIKVRVKRPGVQVRARKGYWALTADDTARAVAPPKPGPAPEIGQALGQITRQARQRTVKTWVGTERSQGGKTRVTFVWEPAPPQAGQPAGEPASRVSLTATSPDGAPYFRGRVPDVALASTNTAAAASAGSVPAVPPSKVVFDVQPGRMQMRVAVEGARGQVLDTEVQEIVIPDFTTPQAAISTPVVLRARNVVEFRAFAANPDAVPSPDREFRRTERLLIRFATYGPGDTPATPTVRLLNRTGQPMSDLPATAAGGGFQIDLPLAGLAVGEYLVEIKAKAGDAEAKELIGFRITS